MWDDIKDLVGKGAPLIGAALGGPAGGAVGGLIASALGVDNDPGQILQKLKTDPDALAKIKQLEYRHKERLESMAIEAQTAQMTEVNKTMRAELLADGWFKSGWRPLLGYIVGINIGLILFSLAYSIFADPKSAADVVASATVILTMALGVLGYNVKQRTNDKHAILGQKTPGLLQALAERVKGNGKA